ncbi:MAG: hypothetical protein JXO49_06585 [Deltaproteobacteria bacterium]|nr:hypothetical protein [Deltaproteobacteria bacterium]
MMKFGFVLPAGVVERFFCGKASKEAEFVISVCYNEINFHLGVMLLAPFQWRVV